MPPAAALLALALAAGPPARLAEARQLADEFQYDKALKVAEAALKEPDLDREAVAALYELVGVAAATLDRGPKAREAFLLLLLVAPEHQLSLDHPPRVRTPYFEARSQAARLGPLTLTATPPRRVQGRIRELEVVVRDAVPLPARAVRFTVREDDRPERVATMPVPPGKRLTLAVSGVAVRWTAELLGERGAVLRTLHREELPPAPPPVALAPPPLPAPEPPPPPAGLWLRPLGYGVGAVGLAALGGGAALGVLSSDARAKVANATRSGGVVTGMSQRDAAALDAAARTEAFWANAGFIGGGVLAAAGAAFVAFGPSPPKVALLPAPGGLMVAGSF